MEVALSVKPPMVNNQHTQYSPNSVSPQFQHAKDVTTVNGVRQDKLAVSRARIGSSQPASLKEDVRSHQLETNIFRSQKRPNPKRKTVQLVLWVKPVVKAELQRIAEREALSVSRIGAAFLEKAIQTNIDMQYGALLQPIIEQAIAKHMRSYSTRLAVLLVRGIFASEQTRSLATNILGRQPGVTPSVLNEILDGSSNTAKRNITRITPQLADLIKKVERWIQEEGKKQTNE